MSLSWNVGQIFSSDDVRVLRGIYGDIISEPWFSTSPAAQEQLAVYMLRMYRRGMVVPENLRSFCLAAARKKFARDTFAGRLDGRRILVVEDDFLIADYLVRSLSRGGAMVIGPAGSIESAVRLMGIQQDGSCRRTSRHTP